MTYRKRLAVASMTMLAVASSAGAAGYETQTNKPVQQVLQPAAAAGPDFKVNELVVADGYMYTFTVVSTYGPFNVTGMGALRKLEREIAAIGQLKNITRSEAFLKSLKDQAGKPIVFVKDVVTSPVDTLTGIPKGVGRLFGNITTSVTSKRNPAQESRTKEVLLVGSFKRDYAAKFNVDPYSSNQVLQDELDKIANASAFGSWSASAAMMPIGGPAGAVISGTSLSKSFNNVLKNEPPSRIRAHSCSAARIISASSFGQSSSRNTRLASGPVRNGLTPISANPASASASTLSATPRSSRVMVALAATRAFPGLSRSGRKPMTAASNPLAPLRARRCRSFSAPPPSRLTETANAFSRNKRTSSSLSRVAFVVTENPTAHRCARARSCA